MMGRRNAPPRSLESRAVGLLARRDYSQAELRARLLATGAAAEEVDALLTTLIARGYLSDDRFARSMIGKKTGAYSRRAIAEALKAKGVAGDVATQAFEEHPQDDDAALVALWRRRFGQAPADEREKARQVRFLQSRGFSLSAIFRLLRNPPLDAEEAQE